jgi:hypothetical protein
MKFVALLFFVSFASAKVFSFCLKFIFIKHVVLVWILLKRNEVTRLTLMF